jgi:cell volume regulation protein A
VEPTLLARVALEDRLLLGGAVLLLGVLAAIVSRRLSVPILIAFLVLGMFLGSDGPGGIPFEDAELARTIGVLGLIAILFEGGLTTDARELRPVAVPAALLSTVGVAVTAAVVAVGAYVVFDFSRAESVLLGAVVGPTDAAAVFATVRFASLRRRLALLLEAESGFNDPTAVALTLGLIAWITEPHETVGDVVVLLVQQLGLGLVIGVAIALAAVRLLPRFPRDVAAFAPVATLALAAFSYGAADALGASGFLAVYIVGLGLGSTRWTLKRTVTTFHEGLAFLAQVVLFVVLGLLVFPHQLPGVAVSALALSLVLLFVARPIAVFICTAAGRFELRERIFLSWAGLRGAVPIVLATFAMSEDVASSTTIFNAVFFVVIVSTLLQELTLEPLARRLGLAGSD